MSVVLRDSPSRIRPATIIIRFSDDPRDLTNAPSVGTFLAMPGDVVAQVAPVLE
jgi:hypothetical protein